MHSQQRSDPCADSAQARLGRPTAPLSLHSLASILQVLPFLFHEVFDDIEAAGGGNAGCLASPVYGNTDRRAATAPNGEPSDTVNRAVAVARRVARRRPRSQDNRAHPRQTVVHDIVSRCKPRPLPPSLPSNAVAPPQTAPPHSPPIPRYPPLLRLFDFFTIATAGTLHMAQVATSLLHTTGERARKGLPRDSRCSR